MLNGSVSKIVRQESGATALEYAIIAGLIGLGLVSALISTKGGLNTTFGTASSQMSASMSAQSGGSASYTTMSAYSARTVTSSSIAKDTSGNFQKNTYRYDYADGSYASREVTFYSNGNIAAQTVTFYDKATNTRALVGYDAAGAYNYYEKQQLNADGSMLFYDYQQGPAEKQTHVVTASRVSTITDPTAEFLANSSAGTRDADYIKTLVANPTR